MSFANITQTGLIDDVQVQGNKTVLTLLTQDTSMLVEMYGKLAESANEFLGIKALVVGNLEVTERRMCIQASSIVPMMDGVEVSQITVCGRLGSDPELKYVKDNMALAKFALATNSYGKDTANWFQCTAWGKKADVMSKFCKKGAVVAISGNLSVNKWASKKDGTEQMSHEVNVRDVFLMPRSLADNSAANTQAPSQASFVPATTINTQEIPF